MKTGVNGSNIFGSTKDNHLNGDRLVFQSVCGVAADSRTPSHAIGLFCSHQTGVCVFLVTVSFDGLCGGRRKNVSQFPKSKG